MYQDQRPTANECHPYYQTYIGLVSDGPLLDTLEGQIDHMRRAFAGVDEAKAEFAYEPGKWTAKQVLGHLADTEAVFAYRALAIARGDGQPIPGMDQDEWMGLAPFNERAWPELVDRLIAQRRASLALLGELTEDDWKRRGIASEREFSVRSIGWILVGHFLHHLAILRERYAIG